MIEGEAWAFARAKHDEVRGYRVLTCPECGGPLARASQHPLAVGGLLRLSVPGWCMAPAPQGIRARVGAEGGAVGVIHRRSWPTSALVPFLAMPTTATDP